MAIRFGVRGEYIQLDQLLKATGLCDTGGMAHRAVEAGEVKVDGQVESRKRAKLRPGQRVEFAGESIELVPEEAE
ncbi:MAG: RNA-binding S4 domain-containing protein [Myxococcales bacterium]|jgi:ribosome-associated protein